jgi:hypothetical protein
VQSWSVPGNLWWFPADLCRLGVFPAFCGAVGDLGLLVDSGVAVGDLGLSEGSGVAVGDLGCRQVLGWLLEYFFWLLIAGVTKVLV